MTRSTNDLTLGVARAQRDLGCRYTIGFYLPARVAERPQRIVVHVLRDGLRALHPGHYRFRDESEERQGAVTAAFDAPWLFETGAVRGHVFLLEPKTAKSWETLIAVSFPVTFKESGASVEIDFGAVVTQGSEAVASFNRRVTLASRDPASVGERRFLFLEPARLAPGDYELRIVRMDTDGSALPGATSVSVSVPGIPRGGLVLVPPILGRPRDETVVVRGDGPTSGRRAESSDELARLDIVAAHGSFEPMLVQRALDTEQLLARNKACAVGRKRVAPSTLERSLIAKGQAVAQVLTPVALDLEGQGKVPCQDLFEILSDEVEAGEYLFETGIESAEEPAAEKETLPFAVVGPR